MEKNKIELNSIEQTSYWWINRINIFLKNDIFLEKGEKEFYKIFKEYIKEDWRHLYLELQKYIASDVKQYCTEGEYYSQETCKNGHDRLNEELSIILNKEIPDVRIQERYTKDIVIYTNKDCSYVWFRSGGEDLLPSEYNNNYILSGDEELLKFDRILLSTIYEIYNTNPHFDSTKTLIENYCAIYQEDNNLKINIEKLYEQVFQSLLRAKYDRIIDGNINRYYDLNLKYLNLKELANYEDIGKEYANKILQKK